MAMITMSNISAELTQQELKEIDKLDNRPILFDEECPEMSKEQLRQFHRTDSVLVKVSPDNMKKIINWGSDSQNILSRLLNLAINDSEMVKKCF